ncbi:hypothetical protein [Photobacterium indicum]|uniref:hypothetical protein n=1 Tax=Photobacterium indicum TaxID=81447 RepID=UPI003D0DD4E9
MVSEIHYLVNFYCMPKKFKGTPPRDLYFILNMLCNRFVDREDSEELRSLTYEGFAIFMQCSPKRISRFIKKLERFGVVKVGTEKLSTGETQIISAEFNRDELIRSYEDNQMYLMD